MSRLAEIVGDAADGIAMEVIQHELRRGLQGREEIITPELAAKITWELGLKIQERVRDLNAQAHLRGVTFDVHCYKKREEKIVGADLAGVIRITDGTNTLAKGFLAQAKVASDVETHADGADVRAGDGNLIRQCGDMIKRSESSYVFVYSEAGIHVIPARAVLYRNAGVVDTREDSYAHFGSFYLNFFRCFIGDGRLGQTYLDLPEKGNLAEEIDVQNAIAITAHIEDEEG